LDYKGNGTNFGHLKEETMLVGSGQSNTVNAFSATSCVNKN